MVRKLKFHEKKLLKKVDFISWKVDNNIHELKIMKKYHIQRREDYSKYNKLSRQIRGLALRIKELDVKDPFRIEATNQFLEKILNFADGWKKFIGADSVQCFSPLAVTDRYQMGLIPTKSSLSLANEVNASSFCRRRLPVMMVKSHMAESIKVATTFIEQGHVRVGPEVVTDPALLVTRQMEDFVTWTDTSAIRKHVLDYNDMRDDFDMLG